MLMLLRDNKRRVLSVDAHRRGCRGEGDGPARCQACARRTVRPRVTVCAEVLEEAIRSLLIEKGVLTAQEIAAQVDLMDSRTPALGAKAFARAWVDPGSKRRLLKDTRAALSELGIDI